MMGAIIVVTTGLAAVAAAADHLDRKSKPLVSLPLRACLEHVCFRSKICTVIGSSVVHEMLRIKNTI